MLRDELLRTFDLILLINLPHRNDRLRQMRAQLGEIEDRPDATGIRRIEATLFANSGPFPSQGARGRFLSHHHALFYAKGFGARSVLILEDDCHFCGPIAETLTGLRQMEWHIFYGGYMGEGCRIGEARQLHGLSCVAFRGQAIGAVYDYLTAVLWGNGALSPMAIDDLYNHFSADHPQFRSIVAEPKITRPCLSMSDVAKLYWFDRTPGFRELAGLIRGASRNAEP